MRSAEKKVPSSWTIFIVRLDSDSVKFIVNLLLKTLEFDAFEAAMMFTVYK
jgi:hypothetical protein